MSVFSVDWPDGSGDKLTFDSQAGSGDYKLKISSVLNEGLDREKVVYVSVGRITKGVTVQQSGMRELFDSKDGDFTTFDGLTFNVLK